MNLQNLQIQLSWQDPVTGERREPRLNLPVAFGREFAQMPAALKEQRVSRMVLSSNEVSRYHALIDWEENRLVVIDQNSSNGTFVNAQRQKRSILASGDTLQIGPYSITVTFVACTPASVQVSNSTNQMSSLVSSATVDIICDLRQLGVNVNDDRKMQNIWQEMAKKLIGKPVSPGQSLIVNLPKGMVTLWVLDTHGISEVKADTTFQIVDLLRSSKLVYRCRVCDTYGPLRCVTCEKEGSETRLCSTHAYTIKDELSAYCSVHIPKCSCQSGCTKDATFRCRRCHKLFGEHFYRQHPNDTTVDYCQLCYRILFERCEIANCGRLGKSKCAYQTRNMSSSCGKPLCAEHSYQWKIWGPHNRGVTLCEHHSKLLGATEPADLLFMMLTAKAPYVRRGKRQSLPNPFRLRRIINSNRSTKLTFDQLGYGLQSLDNQVSNWGQEASKNYQYMSKQYFETTRGLSDAEADLLTRVRAFYERTVGWDVSRQITSLEIIDRYFKPGQPPQYRVKLYLNSSNKGPFIGRSGSNINQLRSSFNIEVDLVPGT